MELFVIFQTSSDSLSLLIAPSLSQILMFKIWLVFKKAVLEGGGEHGLQGWEDSNSYPRPNTRQLQDSRQLLSLQVLESSSVVPHRCVETS